MKIERVLCVCNQAQKGIENRFIIFMEKRLRKLQSLNHRFMCFIFSKKHEIMFIFLKTIFNLSLYLSDRYDKNLSLIYIWSDVYLNVLFLGLKITHHVWLPNSCTKLQFGYQTHEFGYQTPPGDLI